MRVEEIASERVFENQQQQPGAQDLAQNKKKTGNTYQQYMYRMLEIVSHADLVLEEKFQHIIDRISDDTFMEHEPSESYGTG